MGLAHDAWEALTDTIKAGLSAIFSKAKSDFEEAVPVLMQDLKTDIVAMGPVALELAGDAVAALVGTPGMSVAIEAALKALASQGIVVAEHAVYGLVASVVASQPTPSVATAGGPIATDTTATPAS